ncbi:hypothetical protein NKH18_18830 [Streptomyces sp. M10(2022)]
MRAGLHAIAAGTATAVATAMVGLSALTGPAAHAATAVIPDFTDGHGLTRVAGATEVHSSTDFTITVTTPQLSGSHKIRVFLPSDYTADTAERWPVTYFLHGGAAPWTMPRLPRRCTRIR